VLPIQKVLSLLQQTAPRIVEITADLSPEQLQTPPGPDVWSANEVLAHLRSCADVWGDCIKLILREPTPTIRAVNPRTYIENTDYRTREFESSLRAFTKQRKDLLAILEKLPLKSWSRHAVITGAGSPLKHTVLIYATRLAVHERSHLKQFKRIAATLH
jgi:uncharacterized damage-inducible protein DinB